MFLFVPFTICLSLTCLEELEELKDSNSRILELPLHINIENKNYFKNLLRPIFNKCHVVLSVGKI